MPTIRADDRGCAFRYVFAPNRAVSSDAGSVSVLLRATGGRLTIETENVELSEVYAGEHVSAKPGAYVLLAVSDTGIGMDEETKSAFSSPPHGTETVLVVEGQDVVAPSTWSSPMSSCRP